MIDIRFNGVSRNVSAGCPCLLTGNIVVSSVGEASFATDKRTDFLTDLSFVFIDIFFLQML